MHFQFTMNNHVKMQFVSKHLLDSCNILVSPFAITEIQVSVEYCIADQHKFSSPSVHAISLFTVLWNAAT